MLKKIVIILTLLFFSTPTVTLAAAYSLREMGVSGLGQAYAGSSAIAEDATTLSFNAAGMVYLETEQLVLSPLLVSSNLRFHDHDSTSTVSLGGNLGSNAGGVSLIPATYIVKDWNDWKFGLAITSPFGLKTDYNPSWIGRYSAIKSEIKTLDISPSIAFQASPKMAIGLGLNLQYIETELTNAINVGTGDGLSKLRGDDWSMSFNGGLIYQLRPATRIGLSYRHEVRHELEGDSLISGTGVIDGKTPITSNLDLPSFFSLSLVHDYSNRLTLLADVTHTKWSNIQETRILRKTDGSSLQVVPLHWRDSYRYSIGLRYKKNMHWTWRAGIAFDQAPVRDSYRTARVPSEDTTWLAFGARYTISPNLHLDVSYAHIWVEDASLNQPFDSGAGFITGTLSGDYDADLDVIGLQLQWDL